MSEDGKLQDTIRSWHIRARAYRSLVERYPLLAEFSTRLVAALPEGLAGTVLDLGGGGGKTTEALLARFPAISVLFAEPAAEMRMLAAQTFADRPAVEIVDAAAHALPDRALDGAVSSLVLHLLEEAEIFPALGARLKPGARFAFNLWGHSWAGAEEVQDPSEVWGPALDHALADLKIGPRPTTPKRPPAVPRLRTPEGIAQAAAATGMKLLSADVDEDQLPASFFLDFAAMSPRFMPRLRGPARSSVLIRARDLATAPLPVKTARVVLEKA